MGRSLLSRLVLAFAAIGIGGAVVTALVVHLAFASRFAGYVTDQQRRQADHLIAAVSASYQARSGWDPADLAALSPQSVMDGAQVEVFDASGRPVWSSASGSTGAMASMHRQMTGAGALGQPRDVPVVVGSSRVGTVALRLPEVGSSPVDRAFGTSVERLVALAGGAAGLAALAVGVVLARRITAPVRALTAAAVALAAGGRPGRLDPSPVEELGGMARAFNAMADSLAAQDRIRRAFARDVAHELRTPLMILQSQIEGIQDGLVDPSPAALASLHDEILRCGRLVADVETLASADGAVVTMTRAPLDVAAVVREAAAAFSAQLHAAGLALEVRAGRPAIISGDASRLRQVVNNLLSNATKFVPPGGKVALDVECGEDTVVITVADDGPGIPAPELPKVFDRFYRGSEASAGGSGIGLSVVRGIVEAHRGSVTVRSDGGAGTVFTVRLPNERAMRTPSSRDLHPPLVP